MSVVVNEVTSEVMVDPAPGAAPAGQAGGNAPAQVQEHLLDMARDHARTAAQGFDD
ncbi:MAG: hypothetical protein NTV70_04360 [Acidobacteria bacterium]|nr:hypothetical protein [Acidobacteriota bacterium]